MLLGADPFSDFPDRAVAEKALSAGHFIVAVTGHPSESVDGPRRRGAALRRGPRALRAPRPTSKGRVSRLGQKLTAPGFAWPDWMIAAELAAALGADLGVTSANDLADEVAPDRAGLRRPDARRARLRRAPTTGSWSRSWRDGSAPDGVEPIDPMALPGVESVERQGAPPRSGAAGGRRCRASARIAASGCVAAR